MPIYDLNAGPTPPIMPCDLLDGNGDLIDSEYINWVDTDTGEYRVILLPMRDDGNGKVAVQRFYAKPPITFVPVSSNPKPIVVHMPEIP